MGEERDETEPLDLAGRMAQIGSGDRNRNTQKEGVIESSNCDWSGCAMAVGSAGRWMAVIKSGGDTIGDRKARLAIAIGRRNAIERWPSDRGKDEQSGCNRGSQSEVREEGLRSIGGYNMIVAIVIGQGLRLALHRRIGTIDRWCKTYHGT